MICTICHKDRNTKHLDLCVIGSEGVNVCKTCEIVLCHTIEMMMFSEQDKRKEDSCLHLHIL